MRGFRQFVGKVCGAVPEFSIIEPQKKGVLMQRQSGFTLIELMVTVAIVAILAGIAIPSYTSYITRSKLLEATSNLLGMRTKLELYFQDNRTYAGACPPLTAPPLPSVWKNSDITRQALNRTATTYVIRANGDISNL